MDQTFSPYLKGLRQNAQLTNKELASLASVPESLISGLQTGYRRVGECQARRIGKALSLSGPQLDAFVLAAINTCTDKVLEIAKSYPSQILNLLALQLNGAGIIAGSINALAISETGDQRTIILTLDNNREVTLTTNLFTSNARNIRR